VKKQFPAGFASFQGCNRPQRREQRGSPMSEQKSKSTIGRKFKLFMMIFLVLLVPLVMDQAAVDRDTVKWAGRIAAIITVLLSVYGLMTKVFKTFIYVILGLVGLTFLVSEGYVEAPRVTAWSAERKGDK
jgi:hypothetical protein